MRFRPVSRRIPERNGLPWLHTSPTNQSAAGAACEDVKGRVGRVCHGVCVCVCVCWLSGYLARFWRGGRGDMLALARAGRPTVAWMDPVG